MQQNRRLGQAGAGLIQLPAKHQFPRTLAARIDEEFDKGKPKKIFQLLAEVSRSALLLDDLGNREPGNQLEGHLPHKPELIDASFQRGEKSSKQAHGSGRVTRLTQKRTVRFWL